MTPSPRVLSVNVGRLEPTAYSDTGVTGIDKRPVGRAEVRAPGTGRGVSGLVADRIGDARHHGGDDQAVYVYAREDLDAWQDALGRPLANGAFGENLTTAGLDVTGALIGERWRVGRDVVLEVSTVRIPCRTFAGRLGERGWVRRFTRHAVPGAYLRVVRPGVVAPGDAVVVESRPGHDVSVGLTFRALTLEPELLPRLSAADALPHRQRELAERRS